MARTKSAEVWALWRDRLRRYLSSDLTVAAFCDWVRIVRGISVAFRSAKATLLSRSERRQRDSYFSNDPSAAKPQIRSPNFEIPMTSGRKDARKMRSC